MNKTPEKKIAFNQDDIELIHREVIYEGHSRFVIYHYRHRLFNGQWSEVIQREVMERTPAVAILPYDPYSDRVVLIEQCRPGPVNQDASPWMLEIVAGLFEPNEKPDEVAIREAAEEAGCTIESLYPMYDFFVTPSCSNEYIHIYCGKTNATYIGGIHGLSTENENIRAFSIPADEAFELLRTGHFKNCPAIIALQWLQLNRHILQALWIDQLDTK